MKNLKSILIVLGVIVLMYLIYDKITAPVNQTIYVPVEIEVPVPGVAGEIQHDTIQVPFEVKVPNPLNNKLLEEYTKTKDSLERLKLFTDAITIRNYNEIFEDSIQTINVVSKVQGKLLDQDLSYFVKPRTVKLDTVIPVKIPNRFKVFLGAETGLPVFDMNNSNVNSAPVVKVNLFLKNRKDNMLSLGVSTDKRLWLGYNIKL
jgi:hypothetical protein